MFRKQPSISVPLQIVPCPTKDIPTEMLLHGNGASPQAVELETVRGYYQFTDDPPWATKPFKVDTGAAITVIKRSDWDSEPHRRHIRWLHERGVEAKPNELPSKRYRMGGVGGGTVQVYFGQVCLRFFKASLPEPPVIEVRFVAAFDAEGKLNNTLLGLGGESFREGGLCLDGTTRTAHLVRL
jgi:hypothetical protein